MNLLIAFALIAGTATWAVPSSNLLGTLWNNFKFEHNKVYEDERSEMKRMGIFKENLAKIEQHNRLYDQGLVTYKLGINHFADMTSDEFLAFVNSYNISNLEFDNVKTSQIDDGDDDDDDDDDDVVVEGKPEAVDWRKYGYVTDVKFQGGCGSCWTFTATGALEGQYAKKYRNLVSLSEQNLLDCTVGSGNSGCKGGSYVSAFKYVITNGIEREADYPYEFINKTCRFDRQKMVFKARSYVILPVRTETTLKGAVADVGPIAVAIHSTKALHLYSSGYFYDTTCDSKKINHGVLIVGYGSDGYGRDYWIAKNSWGAGWGEEGYFRLARNRNNHCGVTVYPAYPVL